MLRLALRHLALQSLLIVVVVSLEKMLRVSLILQSQFRQSVGVTDYD